MNSQYLQWYKFASFDGCSFLSYKKIWIKNHQSQPTSMAVLVAIACDCLFLFCYQICCLAVSDSVCSMNPFSVLNLSIISNKEHYYYFQYLKLKICCGRKNQLVVLYQVVTNPCCSLAVIFCSCISHLIECETINIPEIFLNSINIDIKLNGFKKKYSININIKLEK